MARAPDSTKSPKDRADWRSNRRPSSFGGETHRPDPLEPPIMARSRVQLASSYAPGTLFTWEGGKGICKSVPLDREIHSISPTARHMIFESIREIVTNWRARIRAALPDTPDDLALDRVFYDGRSGQVQIDPARFQMTSPEVIGYVPYPLLYRCATCGSVRDYASVAEQARRPLPRKCHDHQARWTQIDVVYVHWSGNLEPLSPFNYNYDHATDEVRQIALCTCGSRNFRLKNDAPKFSEWRYVCEGCGESRALKKADPEVLHRLQSIQNAGGRQFQWIEVNMLPVSYRANSAYYPQRASFIEFSDERVVELMTDDRQSDLLSALATLHNVPFAEPSDEEIQAALSAADRSGEWEDYQAYVGMAARAEASGRLDRAREVRRDMAKIREQWFLDGIVQRGQIQSPSLVRAVAERGAWARRYDPIRLTIQHDAFVREHIEEARKNHAAVDLLEPDVTLSDVVNDPEALKRYKEEISGLFRRIGVQRIVLLRKLPITEFSFGFSRVSAGPIYHREFQGQSVAMPVRLKAFDPVPGKASKHPIYVLEQKNEALYVKIDGDRVRRWLEANGVANVPTESASIGRAYLETYADFGPFLDEFKDRERSGVLPRALAPYVYLLLHSLSHQMVHSLADVSGLDRDAIGEHIFPADLAFVIYRKGMTPDLGNISAMWRNHAYEFLRRVIDPRMLRCGSGSLCDARGGACPACIMVSEVSCSSSNLLLSRAALRGGPKPEWEPAEAPNLVGFFDRSLDR